MNKRMPLLQKPFLLKLSGEKRRLPSLALGIERVYPIFFGSNDKNSHWNFSNIIFHFLNLIFQKK